jgi:hypothetical protein
MGGVPPAALQSLLVGRYQNRRWRPYQWSKSPAAGSEGDGESGGGGGGGGGGERRPAAVQGRGGADVRRLRGESGGV